MLASRLSPTLFLSHRSLGLADFFATEFEGTARKASNAEAQPAFTFRSLGAPWTIEKPLDGGMIITKVLCLWTMSARDSPNCGAIHLFEFLEPPLLGLVRYTESNVLWCLVMFSRPDHLFSLTQFRILCSFKDTTGQSLFALCTREIQRWIQRPRE